MVRRAPQRFARAVAIFGGEYLEIELSIGEWNREIDQIREAKTTEFPTRTVKQAENVFLAHSWRVLQASKRFLVRCAGARPLSRTQERFRGAPLIDRGILPDD